MNTRAAALILALALTASLAQVQAQPQATWDPVSRSISLYVPAVSGGSRGDIIKVTVSLKYPGNGTVRVAAGGSVGATTENSVRMAFLTAAVLMGVDWNTIDVDVNFETDSSIEGPSASFAIALAIESLLLPFKPQGGYEDYAITGAIAPDGLNSRVGGIAEKCRAAESQGLTLVYPPANEVEVEASQCRRALSVAGLVSGLLRVANVTLQAVNITPSYPEVYARIMSRDAVKMAEYADANLSEALERGAVTPQEAEAVRSLISQALNLSHSKPYSAASLAFTALHRALSLNVKSKITSPDDAKSFIDHVEAMLDEVRSGIPAGAGSWQAAELLSVAYTRLADAEASIMDARALLERGLYANATVEASYALARIESIWTWIRASKALNSTGLPVGQREVALIAERLSEYSGIAVNYSVSLLEALKEEEPLLASDVDRAVEVIKSLYSKGSRELEAGKYLAAIGYFRESLSQASYYIFYFTVTAGSREVLDSYYYELKNIAGRLAASNAAYGVYSILAASYMEYADVLHGRGDRGNLLSSVNILEHAVFSLIITSMLRLEAPTYLSPPGGMPPEQAQGGSPSGGPPSIGLVNAAALIAVALVAGYIIGVNSRLRRVEEALLSGL